MSATTARPPTPTLDGVRDALAAFGRSHPQVSRILVFGSVARGEATPDSDVDVVMSFVPDGVPPGMAGFAFIDDLENELAAYLGYPVDLVEQEAVDNSLRIGNHAMPRAVARDGRLVYELEPSAD